MTNSDISYNRYRGARLAELIRASGKYWEDGIYIYRSNPITKSHILHIDGERTRVNQARAIKKYLDFDCINCLPHNYSGLHKYAHHLNSSQLLCMMFFSSMIKNGKASELMVEFIKMALNIEITVNADCEFEYTENSLDEYKFYITDEKGGRIEEYEGTTFDFHIQDSDIQIFFEIKLTENGFGKAKDNPRHREKAEQYLNLLPEGLRNKVTEEDVLNHYQLLRNIIRSRHENSYVVFISDDKNPATNKEKEELTRRFGNLPRVRFMTWQEIREVFEQFSNEALPFQFKALK